jgi:hypothetical protein
MATKRPADLKITTSASMTEDEIFDEIEEDLYFHPPSGTMTTYHEFDEFDETSWWYKNPPKEVAAFMSEEELAEIATLPERDE